MTTRPARDSRRTTVVVGAGPAGLTAAHELEQLGLPCRVVEADPEYVGGLARTVRYGGYRFDIGGHRFFTKNDEIRALWHEFLPQDAFLTVPRISRIYYDGKFFDYPLNAMDALRKLGVVESTRCVLSYLATQVRPQKEAVSFEDWVTSNFGRRLFEIFFQTYTEKVWGVPCTEISADWASQRIKGLSLMGAIRNAVRRTNGNGSGDVVKTLIEEFEYPRHGPGMMWETVAADLRDRGVPVDLGAKVVAARHAGGRIYEVDVAGPHGTETLAVDNLVSSMPLRSLLRSLDPAPPDEVLEAAERLKYRDFLTVVLIVDQEDVFPDNWIYIHEPSVQVGRVQNFKNWSPDMVPDESRTCLGLEYFCFDGDGLWSSSDEDLIQQGRRELAAIGLLDPDRVIDGTVVRMRKSYPVYDPDYRAKVGAVRDWLDTHFSNLELCGRNGMHKYNNQDHAMLTALMAARNIAGESWDQWRVNSDAEYHEDIREHELDTGGRLVPHRLRSTSDAAPAPAGNVTTTAPTVSPVSTTTPLGRSRR